MLSAEAAAALGVGPGDTVSVALPDDSRLDLEVTGVADLSGARSLFSSRRGGDLETFVYTRTAVVVSPRLFADQVFPAYERAMARRDGRLKSPPLREVDITLDRDRLDADPATAVAETRAIAAAVMAVAAEQDYLLDNITNTLTVASGDAATAKRLFVFLGVPGGLLAAILAAYAGNVLAQAQRREQAILRVRGAGRRHLLRMLALRTALLTATGSLLGLAAGYLAAVEVLGRASLARTSTGALLTSATVGTLGGFLATGVALYVTGRRSIDREIQEDRARLAERAPLWRRQRLDLVGAVVLVVATIVALRTHAFDGRGRIGLRGTQRAAQPGAAGAADRRLADRQPAGRQGDRRAARRAARRGVRRGAGPEQAGARADLRRGPAGPDPPQRGAPSVGDRHRGGRGVADRRAGGEPGRRSPRRTTRRREPMPATPPAGTSGSLRARPRNVATPPATPTLFGAADVTGTTPVIYGLSNVILRSARTSDPANLAAVDPRTFGTVAPVEPACGRRPWRPSGTDPAGVLVSEDMADFLQVAVGDPLHVLLARATPDQVEITLRIAGLYERLPGFPDGADAVMVLGAAQRAGPGEAARTSSSPRQGRATTRYAGRSPSCGGGAAAADHLQIETRLATLDRDQSSLAALNVAGLVGLDSGFALAMAVVTMAIFVFGLLLQRRREYVTLRAQGLESTHGPGADRRGGRHCRVAGTAAGLLVGAAMGYYLVTVLRPLFVLAPVYVLPVTDLVPMVLLVAGAAVVSTMVGSRLVNRLEPTELLRDE